MAHDSARGEAGALIRRIVIFSLLLSVILVGRAWHATDSASQLQTPEDIARAFLQRSRPLSAAASQANELRHVHTKESPAAFHVRFEETLRGVPVFGPL